ncbi:MAG: hypothetical protein CR986_05815 [Ignavibacteriae bacterium]|nr:MAG: hypothetical protein CR986_05815 [Ignavibacteriota bacterium]
MKFKGCFISVLIFLALLFAIIYYSITNYGDEILDYGKNEIVELAMEDLKDDILKLKTNVYSDSILSLTNNFLKIQKQNKSDKKQAIKNIEEFISLFNIIVKDSLVDSTEYRFLKMRIKNK